MTVNTALAVHDASALSQTPFSSRKCVRINNAAIGKTSVPKKEVSIERAGLSTAVKYEEKHISTQPVRYESENSFIPTMLTAKSSTSSGFTNKGATYRPANIINNSEASESATAPQSIRLNTDFAFFISPAP